MAGRPIEAAALFALGFETLSMTPASVGPVKATLLAMDAAASRAAFGELLADCNGCATLRDRWRYWLEKSGVPF
jgi:phosphotransferase system, enzyme I, PtsP